MNNQKLQCPAPIQALQLIEQIIKRLFHQFSLFFIPCNCYDCILLEIENENNEKQNNIIISNEPK